MTREPFDSWTTQGPTPGVTWTQGPSQRALADGSPEWTGTARFDDLPAWEIDVVAASLAHGLGVTSMTVRLTEPLDAPAGLTSTALKRLRVARLVESLEYELETQDIWRMEAATDAGARNADQGEAATEQARRPGRSPHDPATLRFIAELRLSAEARHSHKPNEEIANYLGRSTAYVTSLVGKATQAGWLGPAGSGRKRREPGHELIRARQRETATNASTEHPNG